MAPTSRFRRDEQALTAVMAVTLLIVIAIVFATGIAVIVFVFIGSPNEPARAASFRVDESRDRISVVKAADNADWSRLALSVASCTASHFDDVVHLGDGTDPLNHVLKPATAAGVALTRPGCEGSLGSYYLASAGGRLNSGDFIAFCTTGNSPSVANVRIQIHDAQANALVLDHTFTDIRHC